MASCNNENKEIENQVAVKVSTADFEAKAINLVDQKIALKALSVMYVSMVEKGFSLVRNGLRYCRATRLAPSMLTWKAVTCWLKEFYVKKGLMRLS